MSGGPTLIDEAELREFVARLFATTGMGATDADLVAKSLVWAEMRGQAGHGLSRVPLYFDFIAKGFLDPAAEPVVAAGKPSIVTVEAHRAAGAVAMATAVAAVTERAKQTGLAFALVRNASHTGAIGQFAAELAEAGFAAMIAAAGPPLMAYHGAAAAGVSTSPLALAVPGAKSGAPIVVDIATSVAAMGKIVAARRAGRPIPPDWALTADGRPTTDATAATVLLPLGGAKGSGLSLLFELMTGVLAANPVIAGAINSDASRRAALNGLQNAFILAVDVEAFRPLADFRADAAGLTDAIKALPRQSGVEEILMPGERGSRVAADRQRTGIPVPPAIWEPLAKIAGERGVKLPATKEREGNPR